MASRLRRYAISGHLDPKPDYASQTKLIDSDTPGQTEVLLANLWNQLFEVGRDATEALAFPVLSSNRLDFLPGTAPRRQYESSRKCAERWSSANRMFARKARAGSCWNRESGF